MLRTLLVPRHECISEREVFQLSLVRFYLEEREKHEMFLRKDLPFLLPSLSKMTVI